MRTNEGGLIDTNVLSSAALNANGIPFSGVCKSGVLSQSWADSEQNVDEMKRVFSKTNSKTNIFP